jgi:hypothetical protein
VFISRCARQPIRALSCGALLCGECQHSLSRANNVSLAAKLAIILIAVGADEWRTGAHRRKKQHRAPCSLNHCPSTRTVAAKSSDGTINYILSGALHLPHTRPGSIFFLLLPPSPPPPLSSSTRPLLFSLLSAEWWSAVVHGSNLPWPGNVTRHCFQATVAVCS